MVRLYGKYSVHKKFHLNRLSRKKVIAEIKLTTFVHFGFHQGLIFFFQISDYLATIKKDVVEGQRYYSTELESGKLDQTKEKMYQQALMQIELVNWRLEMI